MSIAHEVARRSNCLSRHVAAVVVREKRLISTGYNGTPRNTRNCFEGGCKRCAARMSGIPSGSNLEECACSHGEENAIVQAAYHGISLKDSTIYSTYSPCLMCAKMIINAGIKEVVYAAEYPLADRARELMLEAGIWLRQYERKQSDQPAAFMPITPPQYSSVPTTPYTLT
ncbi:hypothetical protein A3F28_00640 [Candidatus Uhrbacteria bacterium RIFCSPHIGHO2_12_FULL_57_11]|uniref:CMP/dCMP-type deaminase domain-containing protein n=2 Tax=Candidatus Uhriibacteriota TaxID=1752732 RepID=A0A1F7UNG0_9BACT|nr:MAG: hypothetical protein A3D72_04735 [Candidatus Uhrbacteria bacterium RIFCSPHIGHO2_02_FULL_57_19]OGL79806.1 MAG: hypothetical protein A3F28_00640 [Candidatus Uhrbacteria bacterium RIFCSPHIGHO2_12_FULL_57_11]